MELDANRFEWLKSALAKGLDNWEKQGIEIGGWLREVRDQNFYQLDGDATFDDWVTRFRGVTGRRAYQLIDLADVHDDLLELEAPWTPANEKEARPLKRLKSDERLRVANFLATEYQDMPITGKVVQSAAEQVAPWRRGLTADPDKAQKRQQKAMQKKVESACEALASERDPVGYLKLFGPPAHAESAWAYLCKMAEAEDW